MSTTVDTQPSYHIPPMRTIRALRQLGNCTKYFPRPVRRWAQQWILLGKMKIPKWIYASVQPISEQEVRTEQDFAADSLNYRYGTTRRSMNATARATRALRSTVVDMEEPIIQPDFGKALEPVQTNMEIEQTAMDTSTTAETGTETVKEEQVKTEGETAAETEQEETVKEEEREGEKEDEGEKEEEKVEKEEENEEENDVEEEAEAETEEKVEDEESEGEEENETEADVSMKVENEEEEEEEEAEAGDTADKDTDDIFMPLPTTDDVEESGATPAGQDNDGSNESNTDTLAGSEEQPELDFDSQNNDHAYDSSYQQEDNDNSAF